MKTSANLYIWRNRSAQFRLDLSTTTRDEPPPSPVARTVAALSFLAIIFLLTFASPASAVVNCFDYVKARLNEADVNPPPTGRLPEITKVEAISCEGKPVAKKVTIDFFERAGSGKFTSGEEIRSIIKERHYKRMKWNKGEPSPRLSPGDVILFGGAHVGFVNSSGLIDHYLQIPTAMAAYMPLGMLGQLPYPMCKELSTGLSTTNYFGWPSAGNNTGRCNCGGLSLNDSLENFREKSKAKELEIWRRPVEVQITNRTPDGGDLPASPIFAEGGSEVELTFVPKEGYVIDGNPTGCGITLVGSDRYKTAPLTENCTVEVSFRKKTFTVNVVNLNPDIGEAYLTPGAEVNDGEDAEVTAAVRTNLDKKDYPVMFQSDCPGVAEANVYRIIKLGWNCTVTVSFKKNDQPMNDPQPESEAEGVVSGRLVLENTVLWVKDPSMKVYNLGNRNKSKTVDWEIRENKFTVLTRTENKPDSTLTVSWEGAPIPKFLERNRKYTLRVTASSDREMPRVPFGRNLVLFGPDDKPWVALFYGFSDGGNWSFGVKGASEGKRPGPGWHALTDKPFEPQSISGGFELEFTFIGKICEEKDCSHILVLDCLNLGRIEWIFKPEKKPTQ